MNFILTSEIDSPKMHIIQKHIVKYYCIFCLQNSSTKYNKFLNDNNDGGG